MDAAIGSGRLNTSNQKNSRQPEKIEYQKRLDEVKVSTSN